MLDGGYTVGEAARMAGVTVRTLHHYEHIALLVPSRRSSADYRLYSDADLDRLTRILYYRELGFGLREIATMLAGGDVADGGGVTDRKDDARSGDSADGTVDLTVHLERQHKLLIERVSRLQGMIAALEKEMEATMSGTTLTAEEKLEIFGADYDPSWEGEAERRWGETTAWRQSQDRSRRYTKDDWKRVKAEGDAWNERVVAAHAAGAAPESSEAMELAEQHRRMTEQHYDCSYAMHRQLADMFVADERFAEYYESLAPGLAMWVHDAIHANADLHPDGQGEGFC